MNELRITGDLAVDTGYRGGTPNGQPLLMHVRPGTSDWNTVNACAWPNDEYRIPTGLSGWALDIGAHIGACTIPLLLDNPGLQVIAVEGLRENTEMLKANAELNGVAGRLFLVLALASDSHAQDGTILLPTEAQHHWIGNQTGEPGAEARTVPTTDLDHLLIVTERQGFVWTKLDCEGCEYPVLSRPEMNAYLGHIEGEVHGDIGRLGELLNPTHHVQADAATWHFTARPRSQA